MSTDMQLDAEKKRLIVRYVLDVCESCGAFMLPTFGDAYYLPKNLINAARVMNIKQEHYRKYDVCEECVKNGAYSEACDICRGEFSFPSEYAFELEIYPKFADDETTYEYICKQCATRAQQTIDKLLVADKVKDLRKGSL